MPLMHAGPRLLALHHKYARFTYSLANSIFAAKQRASAATSAYYAAHQRVSSGLATAISSLAGIEAEDAQALAGYPVSILAGCHSYMCGASADGTCVLHQVEEAARSKCRSVI